MAVNFFDYIIAMLLAGAGGFGGGIGGANIMKEFALNWVTSEELTGEALSEILRIISASQYNGYASGITLAAYLGTKTPLGILGGILGVIAFILPSVIIAAIILKIGEKLYKNRVFRYSLNYINLLAGGLICMIVWQYTITIFGNPVLPVIAGFACFLSVYFNIHPAFIILGGAIIGAFMQDGGITI